MNKLVKGFQDFFHLEAWKREQVLSDLNSIAQKSGFELLLLPQVEFMSNFVKSAGLTSDIVQKEFFHCRSKNNDKNKTLVLRPEITTGVIRHLIEKKTINNWQKHSLFTYGDCFRYENPQKGRYRQFLQWNVEKINFSFLQFGHILGLLRSILLKFNLLTKVKLEINYLTETALNKIFQKLKNLKTKLSFCSLCQKRFVVKNVYRVLDCKNCQTFVKDLININDYLSSEQKKEYQKYYHLFQKFFPEINIIQKPSLTRGLDYYSGLVFEISSVGKTSFQKSVIAGGNYKLSAFTKKIDKNLFGFGFAIGIERLILILEENKSGFFQNLESELKNNILIGVLKESFFHNAYDLQQKMVLEKLQTKVLEKPYSFNELLSKAITNKIKWLLIFGNEYENEKKIILRKIGINKKIFFQKLLSSIDVVRFLKKNHV